MPVLRAAETPSVKGGHDCKIHQVSGTLRAVIITYQALAFLLCFYPPFPSLSGSKLFGPWEGLGWTRRSKDRVPRCLPGGRPDRAAHATLGTALPTLQSRQEGTECNTWFPGFHGTRGSLDPRPKFSVWHGQVTPPLPVSLNILIYRMGTIKLGEWFFKCGSQAVAAAACGNSQEMPVLRSPPGDCDAC